ncbi:MAG TPA: hypothetical protein VHK69_19445 [Chitinophagaceae bacterium]|jgi:hypothetical protein|nr:hypothetical protein [Chitinophagaceae bacterium]
MDWNAIVPYEGAWAHYSITPESNGIFTARLLKYEGHGGNIPPDNVLLVRSVRRWIGSSDQKLIDELGNVIERARDGKDPSGSAGG